MATLTGPSGTEVSRARDENGVRAEGVKAGTFRGSALWSAIESSWNRFRCQDAPMPAELAEHLSRLTSSLNRLIVTQLQADGQVQAQPTIFHVDGDLVARQQVASLAEAMRLNYLGFSDGQSFLNAYGRECPGCLLAEIRIPDIGGLQLQARLIEQASPLPVVFLSAHTTPEIVVRAMKAGALNFLQKPSNEHELWEALQGAVQTDAQRRSQLADQERLRGQLAHLDAKELDVLFLLTKHDSTQSIAGALEVSTRTVELRRARIMQKLDLRTPLELMQFAFTALIALQASSDTSSGWK